MPSVTEVAERPRHVPGVVYVVITVGVFDMVGLVAAGSSSELRELVAEHTGTVDGVLATSTVGAVEVGALDAFPATAQPWTQLQYCVANTLLISAKCR